MNRTSNSLQETFNSGWAIQIYGRDRRILCSLYPSHGWAFVVGIGVGVIIAAIGFRPDRPSHPVQMTPPPLNAPLSLD